MNIINKLAYVGELINNNKFYQFLCILLITQLCSIPLHYLNPPLTLIIYALLLLTLDILLSYSHRIWTYHLIDNALNTAVTINETDRQDVHSIIEYTRQRQLREQQRDGIENLLNTPNSPITITPYVSHSRHNDLLDSTRNEYERASDRLQHLNVLAQRLNTPIVANVQSSPSPTSTVPFTAMWTELENVNGRNYLDMYNQIIASAQDRMYVPSTIFNPHENPDKEIDQLKEENKKLRAQLDSIKKCEEEQKKITQAQSQTNSKKFLNPISGLEV